MLNLKVDFMKKLKKLKLQSYETLSNSEMKNIIGADDHLGDGYNCSVTTICSSPSGVCGSVGYLGRCTAEYGYHDNYYTVVGCKCDNGK